LMENPKTMNEGKEALKEIIENRKDPDDEPPQLVNIDTKSAANIRKLLSAIGCGTPDIVNSADVIDLSKLDQDLLNRMNKDIPIFITDCELFGKDETNQKNKPSNEDMMKLAPSPHYYIKRLWYKPLNSTSWNSDREVNIDVIQQKLGLAKISFKVIKTDGVDGIDVEEKKLKIVTCADKDKVLVPTTIIERKANRIRINKSQTHDVEITRLKVIFDCAVALINSTVIKKNPNYHIWGIGLSGYTCYIMKVTLKADKNVRVEMFMNDTFFDVNTLKVKSDVIKKIYVLIDMISNDIKTM